MKKAVYLMTAVVSMALPQARAEGEAARAAELVEKMEVAATSPFEHCAEFDAQRRAEPSIDAAVRAVNACLHRKYGDSYGDAHPYIVNARTGFDRECGRAKRDQPGKDGWNSCYRVAIMVRVLKRFGGTQAGAEKIVRVLEHAIGQESGKLLGYRAEAQ